MEQPSSENECKMQERLELAMMEAGLTKRPYVYTPKRNEGSTLVTVRARVRVRVRGRSRVRVRVRA